VTGPCLALHCHGGPRSSVRLQLGVDGDRRRAQRVTPTVEHAQPSQVAAEPGGSDEAISNTSSSSCIHPRPPRAQEGRGGGVQGLGLSSTLFGGTAGDSWRLFGGEPGSRRPGVRGLACVCVCVSTTQHNTYYRRRNNPALGLGLGLPVATPWCCNTAHRVATSNQYHPRSGGIGWSSGLVGARSLGAEAMLYNGDPINQYYNAHYSGLRAVATRDTYEIRDCFKLDQLQA
jgi:hypothetical protein